MMYNIESGKMSKDCRPGTHLRFVSMLHHVAINKGKHVPTHNHFCYYTPINLAAFAEQSIPVPSPKPFEPHTFYTENLSESMISHQLVLQTKNKTP